MSFRRFCLGLMLVVLLACSRQGWAAEQVAKRLAVGEVAPEFTFTDIRYLPRTLADFGEQQGFVWVWMGDAPTPDAAGEPPVFPHMGEPERTGQGCWRVSMILPWVRG